MIMDRLIAERILDDVCGSDWKADDIKPLMDMIGFDIPNLSKANLICEYLDIERRGNRRHITDILDKYNY